MKPLNYIKILGGALTLAIGVSGTGCEFLDVVPPEQVTLEDATKNATETEKFLYGCYAFIQNPIEYHTSLASADEFAQPAIWGNLANELAWGNITPANSGSDQRWNRYYDGIGNCHLFLQNLPNAIGVSDELKREWEAEAKFMIAYYHFEILRFYGPCPINDRLIDQGVPADQYPGRSHYDAVTNFIVDLLDEVIESKALPSFREETERGRATESIAYGLKARVLLYAASPLWNGSFPYQNWRNKVESSYDGVNYGYELVSRTYDASKWERARIACQEAIEVAEAAGHTLCQYDQNFTNLVTDRMLDKLYIPMNGGEADDEFKRRVIFFRWLSSSQVKEGNTELIWGVSKDDDWMADCLMPQFVLKKNDGTWINGYAGYSPYLGTMENFFTKDGKFYDKGNAEELQRWADAPSDRPDLINLVVDREPRFYAWMAFDHGDWGTLIRRGEEPVFLRLKVAGNTGGNDGEEGQGYNPDVFARDHCVTGFMCQKFIRPDRSYANNGSVNNTRFQRPLMRTSELYLNLAECYAMEGNIQEALNALNAVHTRAGLPAVTASDITSEHPLIEWIRNERFIEFFGEGQRYYDVRRWALGEEYLSEGKREGLNAEAGTNPSFDVFNTRIKVQQDYMWNDRMYLMPAYESEIGANQQLVQAPGY